MDFDLLVIGAGSAGLATAHSAANYGAHVAVVEMDLVGGTCVNVGCIPKKITWYAAQFAESFREAADYGFQVDKESFNFQKFVQGRHDYTKTLNQSYENKLAKKSITLIQGLATFIDAHTIQVAGKNYSAEKIVIATGCSPTPLDIPGAQFGLDSNGFFQLTKLPETIAIIGAGYIAVEIAGMLNLLGVKVKLLIRRDKVLRNFDEALSENLQAKMIAQGVEILSFHEPSKILRNNNLHEIICENKQTVKNIDCVLVAIGRTPQTAQLNLAVPDVKTNEHGYIVTDTTDVTNIEHIYALGDVAGKKLLTPVAVTAGRRLAARLFGKKDAVMDYDNVPTVIFSHPPVGSVGCSQQEALAKHGHANIKIYESTFNPLFYSLEQQKSSTFMKLITLLPDEKVIGCHLIGLNADEIIQGFAVAVKMGATKKDFDNTIGIHPTSAEELVTMT